MIRIVGQFTTESGSRPDGMEESVSSLFLGVSDVYF